MYIGGGLIKKNNFSLRYQTLPSCKFSFFAGHDGAAAFPHHSYCKNIATFRIIFSLSKVAGEAVYILPNKIFYHGPPNNFFFSS